MHTGTTVVIIRSLMAALLVGLGVVSLLDGRTVVGLLLIGLAFLNALLTAVMYRRRRQWRARLQARGGRGARVRRQGRPPGSWPRQHTG